MVIETLVLGPLETNCYILKKDNNCLIIDPADEFNKIKECVGNLTPVGVIVTHNHFDHIGALKDVENYYNLNVLDGNNLEEKEYTLDNFRFSIIRSKGHTNDSIIVLFKEEKIMFVGDFIFKESIGRTDLGGSMSDMKESIEMIKKYSDITIYPGHGEKTNIDYEKENNYYFNI